jgi:ABC-type antimicrobial peptide transport system, ATPase component
VFQFHFLLPEFTALENVLLPMRAYGRMSAKEMNERAMMLLTSLGLAEQAAKRPNQLSAVSGNGWRWRGRLPTAPKSS